MTESNNIETQSGSLEITKFPKNFENINSQEKAKNNVQIQNEKSKKNIVEISQGYLVTYPMKSVKLQNKNADGKINRKRNWRAVSNLECPGLQAKKHSKKRERPNRRISTRLKGQASPLYFPLTRYKSRSRKFIINGLKTSLTTLPELSSDKKKRGRPKRCDSNDKSTENEQTETLVIPETTLTASNENVENSPGDEMKTTMNHVRKKRRISAEQSVITQNPINNSESPESENKNEIKPKSRPWNIPRNKLPSFTIVNNPLTLKASEFNGDKSTSEIQQLEKTLNVLVYACRICGKRFDRKLSVRGHMKSHSKLFEYKHRNRKMLPLTLPLPEVTTDSMNEVPAENSTRILPKQKIVKAGYTCDICGRAFDHKMGIRGHKKSHSLLFRIRRIERAQKNELRNSDKNSGAFSLGHLLNTRSKAGIFDDIIFSQDPLSSYPIWKKEVRVGDEFQVTDLPSPDPLIEENFPEDIIWSTEYTVPQVDEYLKISNSPLVKFGGRNQEYALHILLRCQGNIWDALNILIDGRSILAEEDPIFQYTFTGLSYWTEDERNDFKSAWIKFGKEFTQIQKYVISKSLRQVIEFYYRWTIECPEEYRKYSRTIASRKYLQTLSSPTTDTEIPDNIENALITEQDESTDKLFIDTSPKEIQTNSTQEKPEKETTIVLRRNLPSPMGTPTRPAKSLKELVSSYQDRKEIKSHSTILRSKKVASKKKSIVAKKERKCVRFQHKRIWSKQCLSVRNPIPKRAVNNKVPAKKNAIQKKIPELNGIPILKSVANSNHKRIINRMGTFPCRKCKRVFDRIKSLNAHMKCHSMRTMKGSIRPQQSESDTTQLM